MFIPYVLHNAGGESLMSKMGDHFLKLGGFSSDEPIYVIKWSVFQVTRDLRLGGSTSIRLSSFYLNVDMFCQ